MEIEELTTPEAIRRARFLLATPEMLFNEAEGRRIMAGILRGIDGSSCMRKALEQGLDSFVLLETDKAAPSAISSWAMLARSNDYCPKEKVNDALAKALDWEKRPGRRWPT